MSSCVRRYIASQTIPCCAGSGHKEAHVTLMEDARVLTMLALTLKHNEHEQAQ